MKMLVRIPGRTLGAGVLIWLVLLIWQHPDLLQEAWARLLLGLATLVWVPLGLSLSIVLHPGLQRWLFPAGLAAALSVLMPQGWPAVAAAVPWLVVCGILFFQGVQDLFRTGWNAAHLALASSRVFLLVGGLSLFADRLGLQPLGFTPSIVLLTALHFHYAGFAFPLLLGLAAQQWPGPLFRWAVWLTLASVPLTALGITVSQLTGWFVPETIAAATVVLAGFLGAWGYLQMSWTGALPFGARIAWTLLGLGLFFSMSLALGYALRPWYPLALLNIPAMRAWHGTVNALVVTGLGLTGWVLQHPGEAGR